ncbi:MFS transporter [Actinoplanes sp. NPDC051861]|uniref:MFS transporter n=1 Tax=Actinoplanes sp. NPDC051861 TaxID=3155170 RepID=UPI003423E601
MNSRAWGVLLVLSGAIFLEGIDVAMFNVALPAIRDDLGLSTGALSGVVSAYVLGYAGFMLLGGRAGDLLGHRRVFLIWLTVFLLFSGLGGFSSEAWQLLAARFVTGVAAAFMAPAGLALVISTFPAGPPRNRALGIYAGTAAGGFSLGLVAGGLLAPAGWRWVFFAPVILSALILAAAIPLLRSVTAPRTPAGPRERGFDLTGALAVTAAMLLLAYSVVRLEHGFDAITAITVLAALVALAAFVRVERRAASPLVRLGIFRTPNLLRVNAGAFLFMGAFAGFQFLVTLYLQELRGWTPLQTGLAMLIVAIDTILSPTVTPRLVNRFGTMKVILCGLLCATVGYALFLPVAADWTYSVMLPTMLLLGLAFSLAYGPLTTAAVAGVAEREHGLAGGLLYTSFQFGTAMGISAVSAVSTQLTLDSIRAGLVVPTAAVLLAVLIVASGPQNHRPTIQAGSRGEEMATRE